MFRQKKIKTKKEEEYIEQVDTTSGTQQIINFFCLK